MKLATLLPHMTWRQKLHGQDGKRRGEEGCLDLLILKRETMSLPTWWKTRQDSWQEAWNPVRSSPFRWAFNKYLPPALGPALFQAVGLKQPTKRTQIPAPAGVELTF